MIKLEKIRGILIEKKVDAFIVSHLSNIRYLSNFSGSNALCVITKDSQTLLTDSRYEIQIKEETKGFKIIIAKSSLFEEILKRNLFKNCRSIGFEPDHLSYNTFIILKKIFSEKKLIPLNNVIEKISAVKSLEEINFIRTAVGISERVLDIAKKIFLEKESELYFSGLISLLQKAFGAEGDSFEPIVAFGSNSAMPHHRSGQNHTGKNEPILIDFGAIYKGYGSDITRMLYFGKPDNEFKKIYQIVDDAKKFATENIKSGISCKKLDSIARNYITKKGFGKFFKHSLGHGIGIANHGFPLISYRSADILEENMIITIEPGIYLPGKFGVRIEDDILVKSSGFEILNKKEAKLIVI